MKHENESGNQQDDNALSPAKNKGEYRIANSNEGLLWLKQAVRLVKRTPGAWIGIAAFLMLMLMIPAINLLTAVLMPVAMGGIMLGCRAEQKKLGFKFDCLFDGLKNDAKELLLLSCYYAIASLAVNLLTHLLLLMVGIDYQEAIAGMTPPADVTTQVQLLEWFNQISKSNIPLYIALGMLVSLALMIPVLMAIWFAPGLIVFQKMSALKAMFASFKSCHYNFKVFLVFGLIGFGYLALGYLFMIILIMNLPLLGIPLFLFSFVVLFAISLATIYPSYQSLFELDIKTDQSESTNDSDSSMLA